MPGLETRLAQEPNGSAWYHCSAPYSRRDGDTVSYRGLYSARTGQFPRIIRLAVYYPSRHQLFITDPVETSRRNNNHFEAIFDVDGTGTLNHVQPLSWFEENSVFQMLGALAGTLLVELAVVLVWIRATQRQASARRVALVAIVGNLITVPTVWTAALLAKLYLDLDTYVLIYAFGEVGAVVFEGALYAKLGRLHPWNAMALSITANCMSFFCGGCLMLYY